MINKTRTPQEMFLSKLKKALDIADRQDEIQVLIDKEEGEREASYEKDPYHPDEEEVYYNEETGGYIYDYQFSFPCDDWYCHCDNFIHISESSIWMDALHWDRENEIVALDYDIRQFESENCWPGEEIVTDSWGDEHKVLKSDWTEDSNQTMAVLVDYPYYRN